jgi:hypothetical protein
MLIDLQRLLQRALASDAPMDVLRDGAPRLAPEERAALDRAMPDGVALAGLIVRKTRFERLCRGDAAVATEFDQDPAGMTELFRRYERQVPPTAVLPEEEAAAFRRWRQ